MYACVAVSYITLITRKLHTICVVGEMNQVPTNKSLSEKPTLGQGRDNVLSSSDTDFYDWELTANSYLHFLLRTLKFGVCKQLLSFTCLILKTAPRALSTYLPHRKFEVG